MGHDLGYDMHILYETFDDFRLAGCWRLGFGDPIFRGLAMGR
jgi:hypothetical protein